MSDVVQTELDWQSEVSEIHTLLNELSDTLKRAEDIAVKIGRKLAQFQGALPYGKFLPFVDAEFGMSRATVYNFIGLADVEKEEPDKFLIIRNFPLYLQYRLASAPLSVVKMLEAGKIPPTIKAIQEAKVTERTNEQILTEARRKAEEESKLAQEQLALFKNETETDALKRNEEILHLNKLIVSLKEEKERIAQEKIQTFQKDTPETIASLEQLKNLLKMFEGKQKVLEREKSEQDELLKQKTKRVKVLTEEMQKYIATDKQEKHNEQIRAKWRQACDAFHQGINQGSVRMVTPLDAQQSFEPDDWARLAEVEETLKQALEKLASLRTSVRSQFVESSMAFAEG